MADPFAAGLDALFNAPGSAAAIYLPRRAPAFAVRVIFGRPDRDIGFGRGQIIQASYSAELRISEVAKPEAGDTLLIGGATADGVASGGTAYRLFGDPLGDLEELTWTCGLEPA